MTASTDSPAGVAHVVASHRTQWDDMALRCDLVADAAAPPDELLTSVRGVVFRQGRVMVIHDSAGSAHVMPGGRREAGETETQTLEREIAEETGWSVAAAIRIGRLVYEHLSPRPPDYAYPFPRFIQSLFLVEAGRFRRADIRRGQWERGSSLSSLRRARSLLPADQLQLLTLALARRADLLSSASRDQAGRRVDRKLIGQGTSKR